MPNRQPGGYVRYQIHAGPPVPRGLIATPSPRPLQRSNDRPDRPGNLGWGFLGLPGRLGEPNQGRTRLSGRANWLRKDNA
jgi:hypothetical protein